MDKSKRKLLIDSLIAIGAFGQVALSILLILVANPTASGIVLIATMAVAALGTAIGVWTHNVSMAAFGTVVLYMLGFGQPGNTGLYVLILASFLGIGTYLEYSRQQSIPST